MRATSISTDPDEGLRALEKAIVAFGEVDPGSDKTLQLALEHLLAVTGADAGAVAVPGEEGQPVLRAQRSLTGAGPISRTVLRRALADPSVQLAISEPPESASVVDARISSILCAPVRRQGKTLAAVYLDRRDKPAFDDVARRLVQCFAATLALALDLSRRVEKAEGQAEEAREVAAIAVGYWRSGALATRNHAFAKQLRQLERVAASDTTVLLLGETGAGKEHIARCVHRESPRRDAPFVTVNCAAIPETLLESELFGHEKGAFTGAAQTHRGKFEMADGGTLFLDEIGEMPLSMQPKILRALEDRRIMRLGGSTERQVNVRLVSATNRDLLREVQEGRFREDLYYRLNVVELRIPPLRDRLEDLSALAQEFLEAVSRRVGRPLCWDEAALRHLARQPWPGNVRELRNVVEKLSLLAAGPVIKVEDVERYVGGRKTEVKPEEKPRSAVPSEEANKVRLRLDAAERQMRDLRLAFEQFSTAVAAAAAAPAPQPTAPAEAILDDLADGSFREQMDEAARRILQRSVRKAGSISAAARTLGLSRQHLSLKCKELGVTAD